MAANPWDRTIKKGYKHVWYIIPMFSSSVIRIDILGWKLKVKDTPKVIAEVILKQN